MVRGCFGKASWVAREEEWEWGRGRKWAGQSSERSHTNWSQDGVKSVDDVGLGGLVPTHLI